MNPEGWDWDWNTELLATVVDTLWFGNGLTWRANFKGDPPKVKPIPRPGEKDKPRPEKASTQRMKQFFGKAVRTDKE